MTSDLDAVVTHHLDASTSGVALFNRILAERLGVRLLALGRDPVEEARRPLLSFKVAELGRAEREAVDRLLAGSGRPDLFLHQWDASELERRLVAAAERTWCGNREVLERAAPLAGDARLAWAPGMLLDRRRFPDAEVSVFSFGMAHKIRTDMFVRLRELLEATRRTYALYVSSATHETRTIAEARELYEELDAVFPEGLYFLGHLTDVAVHNWMRATTFFAAFFPGGVRANNTTVASALEEGRVVITNLDEHSPEELVHMENVIDIGRCDELPLDPRTLERIGGASREAARGRGWDALVAELREGGGG